MTLTTRQVPLPIPRKHIDPPGLWMAVFVGSLVLNGILLVGLQRYLHQLKPLPSAFAPISIDFAPAEVQQNPKAPTKPAIAPATNASKAVSPPSQNQTTTAPNPNSTLAEAGEISIAATAKSPRPSQTVSPSSTVKPQTPFKPSTSTQANFKDPSNTTASTQTDTTSTELPASTTSEPTPSQPTNQVATSGMLLPGFTEPPDPRANSGDSQFAPTNSLPLSQSAPVSKFLMQVKVLSVEHDRAAASNSDLPQQSKTVSSGESGCFVTPEALHYFSQPVTYTLTLDTQGTVVNAVPDPPTSAALSSYQDLALCSLKTLTFESWSRSGALAQPEPNQLVVQVILQKH